MWKSIIELGKETEAIVSGEPIKSITYKSVYASKKAVTNAEFYKASALGLKPELIFRLHTFDYDDEQFVKFNDKVYTILRAAESGEFLEITIANHIGG